MAFSLLYLAFRTLLRALVHSRRGLEAKDLELVAPRPGRFRELAATQSPRLIRCRVSRGAICTRQDRGVIQGCKPIDRSRLGVGVTFLLRCGPTLRV
jgi:hypothetical protein